MPTLILFVLLLVLFGAALISTTIQHGLLSISLQELQRRAKEHDTEAELVYPLRARGNELRFLLILVRAMSEVGLVLILWVLLPGDAFWAGLGAFLLATAALVKIELLPALVLRNSAIWLAARLAQPLNLVLDGLRPLLRHAGRWLDRHSGGVGPVIHSKEELAYILEEQKRLEPGLIKQLKHSLSFGDRRVSDAMTPRSVMTTVAAQQVLSPAALKKLHDSGHSRIPVYEGAADNIVGLLYIHELVNLKDKTTAGQAADRRLFYVNEGETLQHVLDAFLRTRHHLFLVVNTFEEITGVITIEDVIEQLLGRRIVDEFDRFEDLREVAAKRPKHHKV